MSEQSAINVYNTMLEVVEAVCKFDKGGFPINQVSFVAQDMQGIRNDSPPEPGA